MTTLQQRMAGWRFRDTDLLALAKDTARASFEDDVTGVSAQMAYYTILAIFPFLVFLLGLVAVVPGWFGINDLGQRMLDQSAAVMPKGAVDVLRFFVDGVVNSRHGWWAIILGFAFSVWTAASAIGAAIKLLNRAYDVRETRGWLRKRLLSVALAISFAGLVLLATLLFGSGQWLAGGVWRIAGRSGWVVTLWNLAAPALAIALIVVAVGILYWRGPNRRVRFAWATPGAALFLTGWVGFSAGFSYYLSKFASYNATYGSIAAAVILLVFLYWTSFLILVGGELNAALERRSGMRTAASAPATEALRGR